VYFYPHEPKCRKVAGLAKERAGSKNDLDATPAPIHVPRPRGRSASTWLGHASGLIETLLAAEHSLHGPTGGSYLSVISKDPSVGGIADSLRSLVQMPDHHRSMWMREDRLLNEKEPTRCHFGPSLHIAEDHEICAERNFRTDWFTSLTWLSSSQWPPSRN